MGRVRQVQAKPRRIDTKAKYFGLLCTQSSLDLCRSVGDVALGNGLSFPFCLEVIWKLMGRGGGARASRFVHS